MGRGHGSAQLARSERDGAVVEMENFYSRLALDCTGLVCLCGL